MIRRLLKKKIIYIIYFGCVLFFLLFFIIIQILKNPVINEYSNIDEKLVFKYPLTENDKQQLLIILTDCTVICNGEIVSK